MKRKEKVDWCPGMVQWKQGVLCTLSMGMGAMKENSGRCQSLHTSALAFHVMFTPGYQASSDQKNSPTNILERYEA